MSIWNRKKTFNAQRKTLSFEALPRSWKVSSTALESPGAEFSIAAMIFGPLASSFHLQSSTLGYLPTYWATVWQKRPAWSWSWSTGRSYALFWAQNSLFSCLPNILLSPKHFVDENCSPEARKSSPLSKTLLQGFPTQCWTPSNSSGALQTIKFSAGR